MVLVPVQAAPVKVREVVRRDHSDVSHQPRTPGLVLPFLCLSSLLHEVNASLTNSFLSVSIPPTIPRVVVETVEGVKSRVSVVSMAVAVFCVMTVVPMMTTVVPVMSSMISMVFLFLFPAPPGSGSCRSGGSGGGGGTLGLQSLSKQFYSLTERVTGIFLTEIQASTTLWLALAVGLTSGISSGESDTVWRTLGIERILAAGTPGVLSHVQLTVWRTVQVERIPLAGTSRVLPRENLAIRVTVLMEGKLVAGTSRISPCQELTVCWTVPV